MDLNWKRFSEVNVFLQQLECHVELTFFGTLDVLFFFFFFVVILRTLSNQGGYTK